MYGSNFLTALRGYNSDVCRFISCPFGQYCISGICTSYLGSGSLGYESNLGGIDALDSTYATGLMGNGQLCAETLDCTAGQICQSGRCSSSTTASLYGAYGTGQVVTGVQPCTLIQDCLNGQICVNGYCSQSNVAFTGSQVIPQQTSCATGAVCPVGQYCIMGICVQNMFSSTFACASGTICPPGMFCQFGRCVTNGLFGFVGKKK
ncbi:hypothetical protein FO519_003214 [Halicephalobus sp. NKZ332]|nr:hypothetical protein FO519_003214 [Halicephalobus sp. NKZ332]